MDKIPLLSIQNLQVQFPAKSKISQSKVAAVNDISLELFPGEILALVGESGCGKTITALATLGLIPPQAIITGGNILFQGEDLLTKSNEELRHIRGKRISIIFQDPVVALNPTLTVGDQISEGYLLHYHKSRITARKLAIDLLGRVGIKDATRVYNGYPHQLSGGMRQRAMIAMALICGPDLLIADEPTTALDTTVQAQIIDLLLDLQVQYGMSILFISHNLAIVSQIADNIAVMYAGRIMEILPAAKLVTGSLHPYTKGLLETLPSIEHRGKILPTLMGTLSDKDRMNPGCPFSNRCKSAMDICRIERPTLSSFSANHHFACHAVTSG